MTRLKQLACEAKLNLCEAQIERSY